MHAEQGKRGKKTFLQSFPDSVKAVCQCCQAKAKPGSVFQSFMKRTQEKEFEELRKEKKSLDRLREDIVP